MKNNVRQQLERQKRRRKRNIKKQKKRMQSPMLRCPKTKLELSEKTKAVNCGGLTLVQQIVRQVGLAESINRHCPIFKVHLPYTEADHVLNIVYNILAGGTCLEHIELRRNDEAYINLLGAERIPDPTTAGDFCRRFSPDDIDRLMDAINESRIKVWQQQPDSFFDLATILIYAVARAFEKSDCEVIPTSLKRSIWIAGTMTVWSSSSVMMRHRTSSTRRKTSTKRHGNRFSAKRSIRTSRESSVLAGRIIKRNSLSKRNTGTGFSKRKRWRSFYIVRPHAAISIA